MSKSESHFFKPLFIFFSFLIVFVIVSIVTFYILDATPANATYGEFVVDQGSSARAVAKKLQEKGFIKSELFFYAISRLSDTTIKAGTYDIKKNLTTRQILNFLQNGKQKLISVTIPEGLTIREIAHLFENAEIVNASDFISLTKDSEFLASLGINVQSLEGFLFPETYSFNKHSNPKNVISTMLEEFWKAYSSITGLDVETLKQKDFNEIFNTVKLASIVEREYRLQEEAPIIAGVFKNRLRIKMPLQSCATVEYIITEIQNKPHPGFITIEETSIDNPYNTYLWAGLPPGPIANPGKIALDATLNPASHKYLFFRLIDANGNKHHFSETYEEHFSAGSQFYRSLKAKK